MRRDEWGEPTPDDVAAWEAWRFPDHISRHKTQRDTFLAGRVSGRADAAAQALTDAADRIIGEMVCCDIYDEAGKDPEGRGHWIKENRDRYRNHDLCYWAGASEHLVRARAAHYREKGTDHDH